MKERKKEGWEVDQWVEINENKISRKKVGN